MSDPLQPVFPSGCCPWAKKNIKFRHNNNFIFVQGGPGQQDGYYDGSGDCCPPNMNMVSDAVTGDTRDWWQHSDCVKGASDFSSSINFRHTYDRITAKNKEELIN